MTVTQRAEEVRALTNALWFLPPPARAPIADGLHGLGVRIHPELATKELVTDIAPGMAAQLGNWAPKQPQKIDGMVILRKVNPTLAARIDEAKSEQERALLLREIRQKYPQHVADIERRLDEATPEDLE